MPAPKLIKNIKIVCVDLVISTQNIINLLIEISTRKKVLQVRDRKGFQNIIVRTLAVGDFLMALPAIKLVANTFPNSKNLLLALGGSSAANSVNLKQYINGQFIWRDLIPKSTIESCIVCFPSLKTILGLRKELLPIVNNIPRCYLIGENLGIGLGITKKILLLRFIGFRGQIVGIKIRAVFQVFPELQIADQKIEHHVLAMIRTVRECPVVAKSAVGTRDFGLNIIEPREKAEALLKELNIDFNKRFAVLSPGSILEFKRWPIENFLKIAEQILDEYRLSIIIVGSISEENVCRALFQELLKNPLYKNQVINICGRTTVSQMATILSNSVFLVANDGGACHIAAAVKCPVISISNGAEPPNSVEPWGFQHLTARYKINCSPCYSFTRCPNGSKACVNNVSVELVKSKINQVMCVNRQ